MTDEVPPDQSPRANLHSQPYIALLKVIFALTNQPGFDKAAFASSLKTEAAGMPDEYDVARTFLLETAERLAPPA